ncbi:hypothetical protein V2J09_019982 [Rumex salicifolius]
MKSGGIEGGEASKMGPLQPPPPPPGVNRGLGIMDLILRVVAGVGTLASAIAMGTTNETLPFFIVANALVCGYLILSLPLSIFHIIRSRASGSRILLIILDTVALGLLTGGASAAAAIVYLAHNGNTSANWFAICQQFNSFCERISGSLIGSFIGIVVFVLLIILSAAALSRRR